MILQFGTCGRQHRICNHCGKVIDDLSGSLTIHDVNMPYRSKYDFDILNLTLCVDCLDNFVDGCAINPITEYTGT